ncbi:MAG: isoleucine--tRNA ligase [Actinomycetota bacterium]
MFNRVEGSPDLVKGEHEILDLWESTRAFDRLREQNKGKQRWSFLDGPITANNPMGVHHAWGRTYKDAYQRYFAMTGHDQRWQNGFDCQGLWVEVQVEREAGFNSKKDIESYGVERFINDCKARVLKYAAIQTQQSIRLGMWMDWDNSYYTMSDENNYTIWSFLKRCHEKGLIYKGLDAMPWCPRCGTGISEQERKEGYRQVTDDAVYVAFDLVDQPGERLLVWTTTPWTLPANVAAAVNPDIRYLRVKQGDAVYYISPERAKVLDIKKSASGEPQVLGEVMGSQMVGWRYKAPFDDLPAAAAAAQAHVVIAWGDVSDHEGTGIVHIAPGCGKEDFDLGRKNNLPIIAPIDESGDYLPGFGPLSGMNAAEVNSLVFEHLRAVGAMYSKERYTHDYPHCWRCHTPLLFRAVDEWYIEMSWREEIKQIVNKIEWIPDYAESQEIDWLNNMGDWMISKKRYWGLALPIFVCESCDRFDVIGSREELHDRSVEGWDEFVGDPEHPNSPHRPWVDAVRIRCNHCGGLSSRVPEVGNPWLDAGIVPYSTVGYSEDKDYWAKWVPADFVVESFPGQFRNWFYSLLAMSTMMEGIPPFKALLGYALVRDEHGEEMHKSTGNMIEFNEAADRLSSDVMRWMYCRQNPTLNLSFGYAPGERLERKVFGTWWNTYLFFTNYALLDEFDPSASSIPVQDRPEIDRWILSNLNILIRAARSAFESFGIASFVRDAETFLEEVSNRYIRSNRRRFWDPKGTNEKSKLAAYQTLYEILVTFAKLVAPVAPFLSERMYQNLVVAVDPSAPLSIHLTRYPEVEQAYLDEALTLRMRAAEQVIGAAHALREAGAIRVRQPLSELRVAASVEQADAIKKMSSLLCEELNVKTVTVVETLGDLTTSSASPNFSSLGPRFGKQAPLAAEAIKTLTDDQIKTLQSTGSIEVASAEATYELTPKDVNVRVQTASGWAVAEAGQMQIALDTRVTEVLEHEGIARDMVRQIQNLRRSSGFAIEDRITVTYSTDSIQVAAALETWSNYIKGETQADFFASGPISEHAHEVEVGDQMVLIELSRS